MTYPKCFRLLCLFPWFTCSLLLGFAYPADHSTLRSLKNSPPPKAEIIWKKLNAKIKIRKKIGLLEPFSLRLYDVNKQIIYLQNFGEFDESKQVSIASAAKWLTASIVLAGIDLGYLSLESTTGDVLNWTGAKSEIPLWTLLSLTSGLGGMNDFNECYDPEASLQSCAARVGRDGKQEGAPANSFAYGAVHLQIAAAMMEKASGMSWHQMSRQWLFEPTGMTSSYFFAYGDDLDLPLPALSNPGVAGAAISTTADYIKFLLMLLHGGVSESGQRVLSTTSINLMEQNYAARAAQKPPFVPPFLNPYNGFSYGLGHWIQCRTKVCPLNSIQSSVGSGGWYPWLDRKHGYVGLLSTEQTMENELMRFNATKQIFAIQRDAAAAVESILPDLKLGFGQ